jgi:GT2 family glycosyltransferase
MKQPAQVTIVVVPRERFGTAIESLESIYQHTDIPFKLVCVDGRSPAKIRRALADRARQKGFDLIRTDHYLTPNQARNLGLAKVDTPYVVFIDNDVIVSPGWLTALVRCADETGAAIVGPLNCEGRPLHTTIHFAGGDCHVEVDERPGRSTRHMVERIHRAGERLADVAGRLQRARTESAEFHCLMIRADVFARTGPFDEAMLNVRENLDFCMAVTAAGGEIYLEPASVITYTGGDASSPALEWSDVPYYLLRWNRAWLLASLHHFRDKWRLTEDRYFTRQYETLDWRHREFLIQLTLLRRIPSWRLRRWLERLLLPLDRMAAAWLLVRYKRAQRRRERPNRFALIPQLAPRVSGRSAAGED